MDFHDASEVTPPHVEDVIVGNRRYISQVPNMRETLLQRVPIWQGGPEQLFEGCLRFSSGGRGFISHNTIIPNCSTGYWLIDSPLNLTNDGKRYCYNDFEQYYVPYVGCVAAIPTLPAGTLVRVSLARWWKPEDFNEERCYLQLSGWYL